MTQIITPKEVVEIAFTDGEYISSESIAASDIEAAAERWVVPVVGRGVMEAAAAGQYGELKENYLKPAIALYTRCLLQPRLNVSTSMLGLGSPSSTHRKAADKHHSQELMEALRKRARTTLRRLSEYMQEHKAEIVEYDPKCNILNRCSTDGGFIQIF